LVSSSFDSTHGGAERGARGSRDTPAPTRSPRAAPIAAAVTVILLLASFATLAYRAIITKCATYDETLHAGIRGGGCISATSSSVGRSTSTTGTAGGLTGG